MADVAAIGTSYQFNGIDFDDRSGASVSSAGDVTGDGVDDLIIGAIPVYPNGESGAGESYLISGADLAALDNATANGGTAGDGIIELADVAAIGISYQIIGIEADFNFGGSVSSAGDVTGDGIGDLIIGANRADPNGKEAAGESYLISGADLAALDAADGLVDGIIALADVERDPPPDSDDLLTGTSEGDDLNGAGGNDTVLGEGGNDTLSGGAGADLVEGGDGNDRIYGNHGKDTLLGGDGDDRIGDWSGWSLLDGGAGNDHLFGGAGNDTLLGGSGDDQLSGGNHADLLNGGSGNDTLWGNHGKDTLLGGEGDDRLGDWAGWSLLDGGSGNDSLFGGAGEDTLIGGKGDDLLTGGKHSDTFQFGAESGMDTVLDFAIGEDVIEIEGIAFGSETGQVDPLEFLIDNAAIDGTDLVIEYEEGHSIRLAGIVDETDTSATVTDFVEVFSPLQVETTPLPLGLDLGGGMVIPFVDAEPESDDVEADVEPLLSIG